MILDCTAKIPHALKPKNQNIKNRNNVLTNPTVFKNGPHQKKKKERKPLKEPEKNKKIKKKENNIVRQVEKIDNLLAPWWH